MSCLRTNYLDYFRVGESYTFKQCRSCCASFTATLVDCRYCCVEVLEKREKTRRWGVLSMANDRPVSMKTKEYRKVVKPLLERRRRARINGCLNELRNFILEATKQDSVQASKLEKADILEMTVQYLKVLLRQQCAMSSRATVTDVGRFRAGFTECANEISMFVSGMSTVNPTVRSRLLTHLSKCLGQLDSISNVVAAASTARSSTTVPSHLPSSSSVLPHCPSSRMPPNYLSELPMGLSPPSPPHSLPPTPSYQQVSSHHPFSNGRLDGSGNHHHQQQQRTTPYSCPWNGGGEDRDMSSLDIERTKFIDVCGSSPAASTVHGTTSCSSYMMSTLRPKQDNGHLSPRSDGMLITATGDQHSGSVWRPW